MEGSCWRRQKVKETEGQFGEEEPQVEKGGGGELQGRRKGDGGVILKTGKWEETKRR